MKKLSENYGIIKKSCIFAPRKVRGVAQSGQRASFGSWRSLVRIQSPRQNQSRQQNKCSAVFLLSLRCVQAHRKTTKKLARHACYLLFLWGGWYSLIYGCGDRVIAIARLSACALSWLSPRGRSFLLLPSNPVSPTNQSRQQNTCSAVFFVESLGSLGSLGNPLIFTNHFHPACKNNCRSPN